MMVAITTCLYFVASKIAGSLPRTGGPGALGFSVSGFWSFLRSLFGFLHSKSSVCSVLVPTVVFGFCYSFSGFCYQLV